MLKYIKSLFSSPSPVELRDSQLLDASRALLDAQLELEWAEAKVSCLKASVDRLTISKPEGV